MYVCRSVRRVIAGLAITMASAALLLVPTGSAHAQGVDLLCPGHSVSNYQPGLRNDPQQVNVDQKGVAGPCFSPSRPDITAGHWELTATGTLSCLQGSAQGTRTFHWNTGESSVEQVRLTVSARPGGETVLVTEGTITEGVFAGATTYTQAVLATADPRACYSAEGLTSTSGPRTIQFLVP
jgi:hypothetical protein